MFGNTEFMYFREELILLAANTRHSGALTMLLELGF